MHPLIDNKLEKMFEVAGRSKQIEDRQYDTLEQLVRHSLVPNMNAVEIGSWSGLSAVIIGRILQRVFGKLYCIDWYKGDSTNDGYLTDIASKVDVSEIFRRNIEYFKLSNTIELRIKSSEEASKEFNKESLDFIFIDGGHSYENVTNDISYWYPKLKRNRIICGHDYNMTGVKEAVNDKFFKINVSTENDIWWIRKV